jgi:hypothetical protein
MAATILRLVPRKERRVHAGASSTTAVQQVQGGSDVRCIDGFVRSPNTVGSCS